MIEVDKSKFRKEITGPFTGQSYSIRRVRFKEFILEIGGLPLPLSKEVQTVLQDLRDKAEKGDRQTEDRTTRFYISRGVVEPRIWFGPEGECPADQVYWEDLGGELDWLTVQIINYSQDVQLKTAQDMEKFFREPGAGAAGPDGEEVLATPQQLDA